MPDLEIAIGGPFGTYMYAAHRVPSEATRLVRLAPDGTSTVFSTGAFPASDLYLAISPGGLWGDYIYASSSGSNDLFRIAADGSVTTWSDVLRVAGGGLAFSPNGDYLLLSQQTQTDNILRIRQIPTPTALPTWTVIAGLLCIKRRSPRHATAPASAGPPSRCMPLHSEAHA